ncbi:MAG TPA: arginine--tRNA ligase [Bacteroidota bacterium]|nr:arginine--tRNA ligase [Bacteroidota bacterium]
MKEYLAAGILPALSRLGVAELPPLTFEKPRNPDHGDLTTNIALMISKRTRGNPREIAAKIVDLLSLDSTVVDRTEIAGPGFINFHFTEKFYHEQMRQILRRGASYGKIDLGNGKKTQVEFVSANPTGPLTVGHGRGAVYGDTVSRLLVWTNHDVTREYYFNNAGRQMRVLADSVRLRYLELLGQKIAFPEDYYQGEYIKEIAQHVLDREGTPVAPDKLETICRNAAEQEIFDDIKKTLRRLGIVHDVYFNENTLYETGKVQDVIDELRKRDLAYDQEGAVWFRSTKFGGEKDKVIVKSSGEPTYRLPDIAYHRDKLQRGFALIVDILGADHIATYPDVLAGLQALGCDPSAVKVLIHQFVTITQNGEVVKMSTRKANFITLDELIDEIGSVDVVRYFFLMRGIGSHLNFDLGLAKDQSEQNPVYYLQYAHARIASIIRHAESTGVEISDLFEGNNLAQPEELSLLKLLTEFPDMVESCALTYEPHRLAEYLHEVAGRYHKFYHAHRVLTEDRPVTAARVALCLATKTVLANGLSILGIHAPQKM